MNVYDENVMLQTRVNYLQQRLNDAKQEVRDPEGCNQPVVRPA